MNFEDARAAIFARIATGMAATYSTDPVEYENRRTVDRNSAPGPFLAVEIAWAPGEQASLGTSPLMRYRGAVYCVVYLRPGAGSKLATDRLSYLAGLMGVTQFGGVTTQAPAPVPGHPEPGWERYLLRVPFYFNSQT